VTFDGRRHHDMGGQEAGPVDLHEHDYEHWERRVDALMMLLTFRNPSRLRVDELRQNIEALGPVAYDRLGYYERWMHSVTQVLVKRGVITLAELGAKMEEQER
jgi:Nitrile hydratase beta subunit